MSDDKYTIMMSMLSSSEGRQRLAHTMAGGSEETFVYRPPQPGDSEEAHAAGIRLRAEGQPPVIREFLEHLAQQWERKAMEVRLLAILDGSVRKTSGFA